MKMISALIITILLVLFTACSGEDMYKDYTKTGSGLLYQITQHGDGNLPLKGDTVVLHYTGKFENGEVFDSSLERKEPFSFQLGAGMVIKGWDEAVALLHKGDKAVLVIPPELGYGSAQRGPIPANSTLIFDVELIDIKATPKIEAFDVTGLELRTTDSGLKYYIVAPGSGESPEQGSNVSVHYSGYLQSDNSLFDSSYKRNQPFKFPLGGGRVIKGWDEGVALMKIGAKYRFIIPPALGYGDKATGPIPAGSTLIFDVELLGFN